MREWVGIWELSYYLLKFFCKLKTALKLSINVKILLFCLFSLFSFFCWNLKYLNSLQIFFLQVFEYIYDKYFKLIISTYGFLCSQVVFFFNSFSLTVGPSFHMCNIWFYPSYYEWYIVELCILLSSTEECWFFILASSKLDQISTPKSVFLIIGRSWNLSLLSKFFAVAHLLGR